MSRKLDFYFDYVSPYTYLANTQVSSLGLDINFVPVVIVDVMKRVNNQPSPLCPPKGMYIVIDAARWAGIYGVPMAQNGGFWEAVMTGRFSTKTLTRGAVAALKMGCGTSITTRCSGRSGPKPETSTPRTGSPSSHGRKAFPAISGTMQDRPKSKRRPTRTTSRRRGAEFSAHRPSFSTRKFSSATTGST